MILRILMRSCSATTKSQLFDCECERFLSVDVAARWRDVLTRRVMCGITRGTTFGGKKSTPTTEFEDMYGQTD